MPLFVPILRLAMLFLNVYDSYKTLKFPPPSSRQNDELPSVRAMTQRKRDMKGCLAIWIVWCCFAVYERFGDAIVSLFIPFYDEFKSIVLLFLILKRSRAAEPIYLYIIHPLLKPYTSTLDASLELLLMIGDFIFALSTFPIKLGLELWEKRFGFHQFLWTRIPTLCLKPQLHRVPSYHSPQFHIRQSLMDESQCPATTNVDLPYEIQRLIFEMAARSHRGAGFNLIQVTHYVYTWIEPILYERIEILSLRCASSLIRTISAKDRAFLDSSVRALAVCGDLELKYTKPIFAACSQSIDSFSAWGTMVNPLIYLPSIHSPYLRRLALISNTPGRNPYGNPFDIPTGMLTMLTHVVVVSDFSWTPWYDLDRALKLDPTAISASQTATPATLASFDAFQNLTHFAVAEIAWQYVSKIRNVAKKLRHFVILSRANSLFYPILIRRVRSLDDRRFVVVNMEIFSDWPQGDSRCVTTFWETVETLVLGGFISDQGDKWSMGYELRLHI